MEQSIGKISLDTGVRKIEVNDKGEYISFSINDTGFTDKYAEMLKWFDEKQKSIAAYSTEFERKYKYVSRKNEDGSVDVNTDAVLELANMQHDTSAQICKMIDELFGEDSCRKVFGNITPDMEVIANFFEQISPLVQKAKQERMNRFERRYDSNRKGARSRHKRNREDRVKEYGQRQIQHPDGQTPGGVGRNTD